MRDYDRKDQKGAIYTAANAVTQKKSGGRTFQLVDNRPETARLRAMQEMIRSS